MPSYSFRKAADEVVSGLKRAHIASNDGELWLQLAERFPDFSDRADALKKFRMSEGYGTDDLGEACPRTRAACLRMLGGKMTTMIMTALFLGYEDATTAKLTCKVRDVDQGRKNQFLIGREVRALLQKAEASALQATLNEARVIGFLTSCKSVPPERPSTKRG